MITRATSGYAKLPVGTAVNGAWESSAAACSRRSVGVYNTVHSLINRATENEKSSTLFMLPRLDE